MKFLVLNGPNLNLLGIREPDIYGKGTYDALCDAIRAEANVCGVEVEIRQTNHEGVLVDWIHEAYVRKIDGIVFNPAAYTHTSVAILDALKAVRIPTVEVHLSEVDKREAFRQISYVREACFATVSGKGFGSYTEAIRMLKEYLA